MIGTIDVDIADVRLYSAGAGILDKTIDLDTYEAGTATADLSTAVDFASADDEVTFSVAINGAPGTTVTISQSTVTTALQGETAIASYADLVAVYNQAFADAGIEGITATIDNSTGDLTFSSIDDFSISAAADAGTDTIDVTLLGLDDTSATAAAATGTYSVAVSDIDVTQRRLGDHRGLPQCRRRGSVAGHRRGVRHWRLSEPRFVAADLREGTHRCQHDGHRHAG